MLGHLGDQATRGTALWRPLAETTIKGRLRGAAAQSLLPMSILQKPGRAPAKLERFGNRGASTT
jgi:hypothetical protein